MANYMFNDYMMEELVKFNREDLLRDTDFQAYIEDVRGALDSVVSHGGRDVKIAVLNYIHFHKVKGKQTRAFGVDKNF